MESSGLKRDTAWAMSEENVERMRQSQAAFERGDKDVWSAFVHPDVEVVPIGEWPEGHIQGRDAGGTSS